MKKKYKWTFLAVIAVISIAAYASVLLKPTAAEAEMAVRGDLVNSFTVQGTILPVSDLILNASAAGEVVKVHGQPGSFLKAGEVLVETGSGSGVDIDIQREQCRQQLSSARQQYDRLFGENGTAVSAKKAAQSEYDLAERSYANAAALAAQGSVSDMELKTLKLQKDLAYQKLVQAKEEDSSQTRAYYEEQISSYERQLSLLEDTISPGSISMPYDGVVWELYAQTGAYLAPNQPAARIYRPEDMKISVPLLTEDAASLAVGQMVELLYADGTREQAAVTFISPVGEQRLSSIGIEENRCEVEIQPSALPPQAGAGQQADVVFRVTAASQVITVPASAVVPSGTESIVYVVRDRRTRAVPVEAGKKSGGRVEIRSGVEEGEIVLSDPYEAGISDGSRVEVRLSQPSADDAG